MQGVSKVYGFLWVQLVGGGVEADPREVVYHPWPSVILGNDCERGDPYLVELGDVGYLEDGIWTAWTCSDSSWWKKTIYFEAEACAQYCIVTFSSEVVVPHGRLMRMLLESALLSRGVDGWEAVSRSWILGGGLALAHAWGKPILFALSAMLIAYLPIS